MVVHVGGTTKQPLFLCTTSWSRAPFVSAAIALTTLSSTTCARSTTLLIGDQTAEEIKIKIGSAVVMPGNMSMEVRAVTRWPACPRRSRLPEEVTGGHHRTDAGHCGQQVKATLKRPHPNW
ncbi:MAG: rod shape-determining protein [Anaerolineae bacterium]|nr:rod shape-determining protein [Anaerolineae bacterium]